MSIRTHGHRSGFGVLLGLAFTLFAACGGEPGSDAKLSETERMIQLITEAQEKVDITQVSYAFNRARADYFGQMAEKASSPDEQLQLQIMRSYELLSGGLNETAILELEALLEQQGSNPNLHPDARYNMRRLLALTYYRLGEVSNCVDRPNTESCIFPISEAGVYAITTSTRRAIQLFEDILSERPEDYESKWMLNLAYMTLGEYPDKVPAPWRMPSDKFAKTAGWNPFEDVAPKVGLNLSGLSGGVVADDFNKDGHMDIIASSWGLNDQIRYFENQGNGRFVEKTKEAGLTGITGGLQLVHADYDNDGWLDVLILRGAWFGEQGAIPNSLLRNNGNGTFSDVTISAGLLSYHPTQSAVWADFNLDGWLDLFIGNESNPGASNQPCEFYLSNGPDPNTGQVTFTNVIDEMGLQNLRGFIKGVATSDINNDGRPDMYLSMLDRPNVLLLHGGMRPDGFINWIDITAQTGTGEPVNSFPCWFWDFDNDGLEDLFVFSFNTQESSAAHLVAAWHLEGSRQSAPVLYRNLGNGQFANVAEHAGLNEPVFAMGSSYGDINNDGRPDAYIGTGTPSFAALIPNKMYVNIDGTQFVDVTTPTRLGHLQKGHGVAFADFDNDGDEDIYTVLGGAFEGDVFTNSLFINPDGNKNPWLKVVLQGTESNRCALGARVMVQMEDADGNTRLVSRTVSPGGSFGGNSLELLLGLGEAVRIRELRVIWPNSARSIESFNDLPLRKKIKIIEGSGTFEVLAE